MNVKQVERIIKPGIYSDGGGLYLRVRNSGTRSWLYVCWLNGRRREMGLGSVQDVSLAKAREKAAAARSQYLDGIDPIAARKAVKVDKKPEVTFGAFAIELLDSIEDGFKNPKHRQQWRSTLTTYAAPMFELPIGEVKAEHVLEVLKPIWLSKAETASRLRGRIERILDAAKAQGLRDGDNPARGKGHLDLLLPKRSKTEVRHHAALSHNQVAAFMTELASRPAMAARALEFTVLTAARSGETRGMTWGEVDLENSLWTVPAERMKAGETHQVPLSASALAVLRSVKPDDVIADKLVFPAPRGGTMSDMSMAQLLKRMGRTDITVHGFRSTFRDWAGDTTNFGREEVEMSLAHTIQSATERAYRRGRALDKRRDLMDAWAKYCSRQI
ncbi:integrase [Sphingobium sp. B1D7B]|uniref:tyrosine-type recombinase/integrase n=1 Tax=unclassified Sphingobium TaxID=2611147 RepID=UPI0022249C91|nr:MULTISPECIES: site-specific integrase [unclassified Sphingobium]MCW2403677.1 integrase [Sphingobium sp. B1D7B]